MFHSTITLISLIEFNCPFVATSMHIFMSIKKDVQFANLKFWDDVHCWINSSGFLRILILVLKSHERVMGCYMQACGSGSETDLYCIKRRCEPDNTLMPPFFHSNPVGFVPKRKHWNYSSVQGGHSLQDFQALNNLN